MPSSPDKVLDWSKFQSLFWGDKEKVQDWRHGPNTYGSKKCLRMVNSIRYVYSWQMVQLPQAVLEECPLGYLTAVLIKAFTCATSGEQLFSTLRLAGGH